MKKRCFVVIVMCCFLVCLFSSCNLVSSRSQRSSADMERQNEYAVSFRNDLIQSINENDKEKLRSLFSVYAQEGDVNLDEQIETMLAMFPNRDLSYPNEEEHPAFPSRTWTEYGEILEEVIDIDYLLQSGEQQYEVSAVYRSVDAYNPDRVGLYSMQIFKKGAVLRDDGSFLVSEEFPSGIYFDDIRLSDYAPWSYPMSRWNCEDPACSFSFGVANDGSKDVPPISGEITIGEVTKSIRIKFDFLGNVSFFLVNDPHEEPILVGTTKFTEDRLMITVSEKNGILADTDFETLVFTRSDF